MNTKQVHIDFATKVNMKTIDDLSKVEQKMTWNPYMNQKNQITNIYNEKTKTNQGKPLRENQMLKKRNLSA